MFHIKSFIIGFLNITSVKTGLHNKIQTDCGPFLIFNFSGRNPRQNREGHSELLEEELQLYSFTLPMCNLCSLPFHIMLPLWEASYKAHTNKTRLLRQRHNKSFLCCGSTVQLLFIELFCNNTRLNVSKLLSVQSNSTAEQITAIDHVAESAPLSNEAREHFRVDPE